MLEKYGPVIGAAILMLIIVLARHFQHEEERKMDWLTIVEKLAPVVLALIPGVPARLVPVIIDGIAAAELAGGSSQEKKAVAVSKVMNATSIVPLSVYSGAVSKAIDAVVATANSTQEAAK